ncbi:26924_t:CDS:1, partial [Gigaspora margarita]
QLAQLQAKCGMAGNGSILQQDNLKKYNTTKNLHEHQNTEQLI